MVNPLIWPTKIRMITQIWEIKSLTITKQQGFWTLLRLSVRLLRSVGALHGVVEFPQRLNLKKPGCGEAIPDGQLVGWSWLIAANSGVRCLTWIRRLNGFGPTNHSLSVDFFMVNGGNMMEWCYITWCMMATGVGNCWLIVVWCVLFQWYSIIYWGDRWIFWHIHIYIHTQLLLCTCPSPNLGCTSGVVLFILGLHQKAVFPNADPHNGKVYTNKARYDDMMIWRKVGRFTKKKCSFMWLKQY